LFETVIVVVVCDIGRKLRATYNLLITLICRTECLLICWRLSPQLASIHLQIRHQLGEHKYLGIERSSWGDALTWLTQVHFMMMRTSAKHEHPANWKSFTFFALG